MTYMKMKKQDIITILSAFLVGIVAGSYLYVVGFLPQVAKIEEFLPGMEDTAVATMEAVAVAGEIYGGRRVGTPPSFVLMADGTYIYTAATDSADASGQVQSGQLPLLLQQEVATVLTARALAAAAVEVTPDTCAMFADGVEYRYRVTRDETEYLLDTCGTDFARESAVGMVLEKLWQYFEEVSGGVPAADEVISNV